MTRNPRKKPSSGKSGTKAGKTRKTTAKKEEDFRTAFLKSLQEKREELKETIERLVSSRKEYNGQLTAGDFIDEVDDAQREISAYSHYSLIERKNKELRKVELLIKRIQNEEEFGICEECGARIPKERLLIVPEATLCVSCQRELEKFDSSRLRASKQVATFAPQKAMEWEGADTQEDDDNLRIKYQIDSLPDAELEETEPDELPDEKTDS